MSHSFPETPNPQPCKAHVNYDISPDTIKQAAERKFGSQVRVSPPYWVDEECVRVGVALEDGNISFGANYDYKAGRFV